jgi:hypothetical protein
MAVYINKEGKFIIESRHIEDAEGWLNIRKSIIESIQFQNDDTPGKESTYFLLDLLLDLEPTYEQAKNMFNT